MTHVWTAAAATWTTLLALARRRKRFRSCTALIRSAKIRSGIRIWATVVRVDVWCFQLSLIGFRRNSIVVLVVRFPFFIALFLFLFYSKFSNIWRFKKSDISIRQSWINYAPRSFFSSRRAFSAFMAWAFLSVLPLFSSTVFLRSLLRSLTSLSKSLSPQSFENFESLLSLLPLWWEDFFLCCSLRLAALSFFSISNLSDRKFIFNQSN